MRRIILTGERNRGKTAFCRSLVEEARGRGLTVAGILSLKDMDAGELKALRAQWITDQPEGETRELARFIPPHRRSVPGADGGSRTPSWAFCRETFLWGNALIRQAPPADLFILDEAGPLEFTPNSPDAPVPAGDASWQAGMERVNAGTDGIALVVVRPELTDRARLRWPDAELLRAPVYNDPANTAKELIERILK